MTTPAPDRYLVLVQPTRDNLAALANMDLQSGTPLTVDLTSEQFQMLPHRRDMRRNLVVVHEKLGVEHTYTSGDVQYDLNKLLECYNDEDPPQKFGATVDPDNLSLDDTLKLLNVIASCSDEEDRIQPWNAGTSVSEALTDHELDPATIFATPKAAQPLS